MTSKRAGAPAAYLFRGFKQYERPTCRFQSTLAPEADLPMATLSKAYADAHLHSVPTNAILKDEASSSLEYSRSYSPRPATYEPPANPFLTTTTCTLHRFPGMEPTRFATYPSTHLLVPLRKDILHRAVVYEGDRTRQGTASTKWRSEVHGSGRKLAPQKGLGRARVGDKKSPIRRGGGVAFGPKPRDFATGLQKKVYDLAWRTALSYRYKMGQLLVLDGSAELEEVPESSRERYLRDMLRWNRMAHPDGRTLFVTMKEREGLFEALAGKTGREARALDVLDVDVKDLLELGRVAVEKDALDWMLQEHESDLAPSQKLGAWEAMIAAREVQHQQ